MSTEKTNETTPSEPAQASSEAPKVRQWGRFHVWLDALVKKAEQRPAPDTSSET